MQGCAISVYAGEDDDDDEDRLAPELALNVVVDATELPLRGVTADEEVDEEDEVDFC